MNHMNPPRSPRSLPLRLGAAVVAAMAAAGAVPAGAQTPAPAAPGMPPAPAGQRGTVTLNFVNADIEAAQAWSNNVFWASCPNANLYIENKVPELSEQFKGLSQFPSAYSFGNDFPIVIYK